MVTGTVDITANGVLSQVAPGTSLSVVPDFEGPGVVPAVWTLAWSVQRDPATPFQSGERVRFTTSSSAGGEQQDVFRFELDLGGATYGQPSAIGYSFAGGGPLPLNLNPLVCTDPVRPLNLSELSGELTIDSDFDPIPALPYPARWVLALSMLGAALWWWQRRMEAQRALIM